MGVDIFESNRLQESDRERARRRRARDREGRDVKGSAIAGSSDLYSDGGGSRGVSWARFHLLATTLGGLLQFGVGESNDKNS